MNRKIIKIADNIFSPLGMGSHENYLAVKQGRSGLSLHTGLLPEDFMASMFDREEVDRYCGEAGIEGVFTLFEKVMLLSAKAAIEQSGIDVTSDRVVFVVSSTKGNVELLGDMQSYGQGRELIHVSAALVARHFSNPNLPIVVSNACISGLCAQIEAMRALKSGRYDYAVVIGADVLSRFIVSGFQSFKALSRKPCRPFDKDREGLNLGEAAATIVYKAVDLVETAGCDAALGQVSGLPASVAWEIVDGAIRNDANHISGPSRTGEGSFRALQYVLENVNTDELAFVNVHGTSTAYNDEMESIALDRAALGAVPVNALKAYFGHTLGAAGVLETILSMQAVDDATVLATKGFAELGVSCPVNLSNENRSTDKKAFVKMLSGFGGCNAAVLFRKGGKK